MIIIGIASGNSAKGARVLFGEVVRACLEKLSGQKLYEVVFFLIFHGFGIESKRNIGNQPTFDGKVNAQGRFKSA